MSSAEAPGHGHEKPKNPSEKHAKWYETAMKYIRASGFGLAAAVFVNVAALHFGIVVPDYMLGAAFGAGTVAGLQDNKQATKKDSGHVHHGAH
ncbi:MAG TPA: hypothetical protein VMU13_02020 [Candidatus Paceibacterota bacterium]|nr:hypothetical protein [Candidatus Paceibacterota bacterium]